MVELPHQIDAVLRHGFQVGIAPYLTVCCGVIDAASPMIEYYWRDGTFNALEELRTGDPYNRKYGNGRSI